MDSREKVVRGEQASKIEPATLGESFVHFASNVCS